MKIAFNSNSKKIGISLLLLCFATIVNAQIVNIPDANFKAALIADVAINTNFDGEIQVSEAVAYTGPILIDSLAIADLTGIESFTSLTQLNCEFNNLSSIDLSNNLNLGSLICKNNSITTLQLGANVNLAYFDCSLNQLTSLDLTQLTGLSYLRCEYNNLTSLNLNNNSSLEVLYCYNNSLSNLDFTYNPNLISLYCYYNQITNLDLSSLSMIYLGCQFNDLISLNIQNGNNSNLVELFAFSNPNLTCVQVDNVAFMNTNWAGAIDGSATYSLNCAPCGALPTPLFSINNNNLTTAPATATFTNTTSILSSYDFLWDFGDGSAMNNDNVTLNHTYSTNGIFYVSLTLHDAVTGCDVTNYDPANTAQTIVCNVPAANICGFTPTISPNGVVNACVGSEVQLTVNPASYPAGSLLQWNKDGVTIIGENYSSHSVSEEGFYTVTVFGPSGCPVVSDPLQVIYSLPSNVAPTISSTGTSGPCGSINLTLTANGSFGSYVWNTGQTSSSITVTQAGVYSVTGQGGVGCNLRSAPVEVSTSTFSTPEICMVDVDTITNHAVIVWEKPILTGITGFGIYKETSLYSENYQQIAVVPYDSLSEYIDLNSDASAISERYRISVIDSCGGESSYSAAARVIGLKVLPGIGAQRVLTWNYYVSSTQNFTEYKIYSGPAANQLSLLTTVPASINSNYIDANPVNGINTVYRIYADMIIPCESTRGVRNRSVSNGNGNFQTPFAEPDVSIEEHKLNEIDFTIVPNPSNGMFNLSFNKLNTKELLTVEVYDMLGHLVNQKQMNNGNKEEIDLSFLSNSTYNLRITNNNAEINKRFQIIK